MRSQTARWVRKAEADWLGAQTLGQSGSQVNDLICFHCQQMAEKYLKALLQEAGVVVPRTHNLEDLWHLLLPHDATLRPLRRSLVSLSRFAVDYRYPGMSASRRDAQSALRMAERLRKEFRRRLGLS